MFYIDRSGGMHITRGDSATISTELYSMSGEPIMLSDDSCIIFSVRSKSSGDLKIKRTITNENYENDMLVFGISAEETLIEAAVYEYSLLYIPDKNIPHEQAFTYAQGDFEVMHSVTTYKDSEG